MKTEIGEYLRSARLSVRMTQAAAASEAGLSRQQLNRIENGGSLPEWPTVDRLVAVYGGSLPEAVRIFTGITEAKPDAQLAHRLGQILARAEPSKRPFIADTLAELAERMVGVLAPAGGLSSDGAKSSTNMAGKRRHNAVLWQRLGGERGGYSANLTGYSAPGQFPIPAV